MKSSTSRRRTAVLLTAGLALTAALAGCGSSTANKSSGFSERAPAPAGAPGQDTEKLGGGAVAGNPSAPGAPAANGGNAQAGNAAGKPTLPQADTGRSIIYTGSMTVRVTDVNAKASELTSLAIGAGGLVSADERQSNDGKSVATITVRIPAARFTDVLNQISKLGKEESRQVSTQDVTATVIDLNARIQSQQASVDRVRALLARAQSIADITSIESELARREADLESMEAQQRNLADLTALSTIAVTLLGPEAAAPEPPKPAESGFLGGLKRGWHALSASVGVLLTILGAVLPFAVVLGIPAWALLLWLRRRARRAHATTATAPLSSETAVPKAGSTM